MKLLFMIISVAVILTACVTNNAGIRDPERFIQNADRIQLHSVIGFYEIAECFKNTATFTPQSKFEPYGPGYGITYSLKNTGKILEEIWFMPNPDGGSVISVFSGPTLKAKGRRVFFRDRIAPLKTCTQNSDGLGHDG